MAKHKTVPKGAYTKKYYVAAVTDQQAGDKVIYRTDGTIFYIHILTSWIGTGEWSEGTIDETTTSTAYYYVHFQSQYGV